MTSAIQTFQHKSEIHTEKKISSEDRSKSPEKETSVEKRDIQKEKSPMQDKKKKPDNFPKEKKPMKEEKRLSSPSKEQIERKSPEVKGKEITVEKKLTQDKMEDQEKQVRKSPERIPSPKHSPGKEIPRKKPDSFPKELSKSKDEPLSGYDLNKISPSTKTTAMKEVHTTVIMEKSSSDFEQKKSPTRLIVEKESSPTETDKDFSKIITDKSLKSKMSIEKKEMSVPKKDSPKQTKSESHKFESSNINVINRKETVVKSQKHIKTEKSPREHSSPIEDSMMSNLEGIEIFGKRASPSKEIENKRSICLSKESENRRSASPIKESEKQISAKYKSDTESKKVIVEEHVTIIDKKTQRKDDSSPKREMRKTVTIESSDQIIPLTLKKEKPDYIFEREIHEEKPKHKTPDRSPESSSPRTKEFKKLEESSKTIEKEIKNKSKTKKVEKSPERPTSLTKGITKYEEIVQVSKKETTDKKGINKTSPDLPKRKSLQEIPKSISKVGLSTSPVKEYSDDITVHASKVKETSTRRKSPEKSPSKEIDIISTQIPSVNGESTTIQSVTVSQGPTIFTSTTSTKKSATVETSSLKEMVSDTEKSERIPSIKDEHKWQVIPQQTVSTSTTTMSGPSMTKKEFNVTRKEVIVTETYTERIM